MKDDEKQTARVGRLIQETRDTGGQLFIPEVVVVETVWVLRSVYKVRQSRIIHMLQVLLQTSHLVLENSNLVDRAIIAFQRGRADLSDYLIREHADAAGCETVVTFDRKALKEDGYSEP